MHPFFLTVIGAIFILSLVVILLWIHGRDKKYLNALLATGIFGIAWYAMIFLLTSTGYIKYYPLLFNKGLPLYYTIGPCFYLYLKGELNPEFSKFDKKHLLHFILVIPALISVMPYNLLDTDQQQLIVNRAAKDIHYTFSTEKYIVEPWHWFTFPLSALTYSILQIRLTYIFARQKKNIKTIRWAYFFSGLLTLIFSGMLVLNMVVIRNVNDAYFILHRSPLILSLAFAFLLLSLSFFLNPETIFGLSDKSNQSDNFNINGSDSEDITNYEKRKSRPVDEKLIEQVEQQIMEKEIFKQAGLTMSELAAQLDIPNHKLSDLFNKHYQSNFNTHINNLRIEYIKKRMDSGDWKQYTLEAIALEAGFSSRNTFFVAFKKVMDKSPSAYLAGLKSR